MKKNLKAVIITASILLAVTLIAVCSLYFGLIHINNPELNGFTVKGVDVSSYQGNIDWPLLASRDIDFAYIKATEGSSSQPSGLNNVVTECSVIDPVILSG